MFERFTERARKVVLDYSYGAAGRDDLSETVDYGAVIEGVAGIFEQEEFWLLETAVRRVGDHVLDRFPQVWEVTVTATKTQASDAREVSGVSVEATFDQ